MMKYIFIYLMIINIIGLLMMGYDKSKAKLKGWRIPEARIFSLAMLGAALGIFTGMKLFHHKTMHKRFLYGIPLILLLNIVVIVFISTKVSY